MKKLLLTLILPTMLSAIDYSPWFNRILEPEVRAAVETQWGREARLTRNELSLKVTPWTDLRFEAQMAGFASNHYGYNGESFEFSGQYRFMNDLVGDLTSVVGGITYIAPFAAAKREVNLFYPGSTMVEFHLSIGDESPLDQETWFSKRWFEISYGIANRKSPWWRFYYEYTQNLFCFGEAALFFRSVVGAGKYGYEFGGKGRWRLEEYSDYLEGLVELTYYRRPYAHRLKRVSAVELEYTYAF